MWVVFNNAENKLLERPFRRERDANVSRDQYIVRLMQKMYYSEYRLKFYVCQVWAYTSAYMENPKLMIGTKYHNINNVISVDDVDELINNIQHCNNIIQVKKIKVTFED